MRGSVKMAERPVPGYFGSDLSPLLARGSGLRTSAIFGVRSSVSGAASSAEDALCRPVQPSSSGKRKGLLM